MSAPQNPTTPSEPPNTTSSYARLTRNISLTLLILCPAVAALPPRKLDLHTFGLGAAWLVSANHLLVQSSGRGILQRVRMPGVGGDGADGLPSERAREVRRRLREERDRLFRERQAVGGRLGDGEVGSRGVGKGKGVGDGDERGLLERVWMGDEKEGWKEERLREEREAISEGRGYGGLIVDQIKEVWTWKKRREEEDGDDGEGKKGG